MSSRRESSATHLEEKIRLLEAENEILNERSEDVLLLGLVAEATSSLDDCDRIFETLLERVSILYEIPYCGYASLEGEEPELQHEYSQQVESMTGSELKFEPRALQRLESGALSCSHAEARRTGIVLELAGLTPNQILAVPCSSQSRGRGVFVFAHETVDPDLLARKLAVLQQVIGLAMARIDNIHLLGELRQLNQELERRVADRTAELNGAAEALHKEVAVRRTAEKLAIAERRRLHAIVEHLPEGVIVLDDAHMVLLTNPAAARVASLLGPDFPDGALASIGGRPLSDFLSDSRTPRWQEVQSQSDPPLAVEATARRLGSDQQGSVLVLRDVTEQRALAGRLLRQERVAAMGSLAAGVAHDFNNLIQAVTILAESLLIEMPDELTSPRQKIQEILIQGERGAKLIRQILDYSRQTVTKPQAIDVGTFLGDTLALFKRLIPESVHFELDIDPDDHLIRMDPVQLQQVLTNLTLNSSQAMPNGGVIRIRLRSLDCRSTVDPPIPELAGGVWVCLSHSDTGCGIPPAVRERIFEPFFTTKEPSAGTGLGLAQTQGIIHQSGGYIDFESSLDRGTTFTVYLPRDIGGGVVAEQDGAPATAPEGRGETVLVVEDDPAVRGLIQELIETLGYRPCCAANGIEALEMIDAAEDGIALVLSDVVMPEMGGAELMAALWERHPEIGVILMSGYAPELGEATTYAENLAGWLQKPFNVNDLATTLANARRSIER